MSDKTISASGIDGHLRDRRISLKVTVMPDRSKQIKIEKYRTRKYSKLKHLGTNIPTQVVLHAYSYLDSNYLLLMK